MKVSVRSATTSPKRFAADPNANVEAERVAVVAKIGENIKITRHARIEVSGNGLVAAYIHTGAKVGVLVEVGAGKPETTAKEEFKQLVRDITLQIAAGHPHAVSREEVPLKSSRRNARSPRNPTGSRASPRRRWRKSWPACWTSFFRPTASWTRAS